jgi:ornithine lipid hydroxylase
MRGRHGLVRHVLFPVVLLGNVAVAFLLCSLAIPNAIVVAITAIAATLVVFVAQRRLPFSIEWQKNFGDTDSDTGHLVVTLVVAEGVGRGLAVATVERLTTPLHVWPNHWPVVLQLLLAIGLCDAMAYLGHRALHAIPLLWRFHRIHHAAPRLYWLNAFRNHPVDVLVSAALTMLPLVLLGAGATVRVLSSVVITTHLLLQHANIDLARGPLDWLFATTPLHRFHHDRNRAVADSNFGRLFIVWDIFFGTRRLPAEDAPHLIGVDDAPPVPTGWWNQVRLPFRPRIGARQDTNGS